MTRPHLTMDTTAPSTSQTPPSNNSPTTAASAQTPTQSLQLPVARVKRIMQEDKDLQKVSMEAVIAVTAAAEQFLMEMGQLVADRMRVDKRKTLAYKDVSQVVSEYDQYHFLDDIVPPMVKLKTALAKRDKKSNLSTANVTTTVAITEEDEVAAQDDDEQPQEAEAFEEEEEAVVEEEDMPMDDHDDRSEDSENE